MKIKAAGGIAGFEGRGGFYRPGCLPPGYQPHRQGCQGHGGLNNGNASHEAANGAFAKTVLMPGDPLRAKFIAETFLEDARLVNHVRGVNGYTGTYRGTPVSVMASGMGMPSIGIYSPRALPFLRCGQHHPGGQCRCHLPKLKLRMMVMAQGACTDSNYAHQFGLPGLLPPLPTSACWRLRWRWPGAWAWSLRWGTCSAPMCSTTSPAARWNGGHGGPGGGDGDRRPLLQRR